MILKKIKRFIFDPKCRFSYLSYLGFYNCMRDDAYLKREYELNLGKKLDLENPRTFDEKLQWLKLNDRNPLYTRLVDKYEVKKYITDNIGKKYVIPTLAVCDSYDEIDFDKLPNKFVIKCTHDCGGIIICKNKEKFDHKSARKKIEKCLKRNYYLAHREWPYKGVVPRILIEEYKEDSDTLELRDYKFYCFNGKVKAMLLTTNRQSVTEELSFDYFDDTFNHLNIINHWHPNAKKIPEKPKCFEQMVKLAERLSVGFPHIRIDFYEVDGQVFFGEFTFYAQAGYLILQPGDWELEWGKMIDLSLAYNGNK